MHSGRIEKKAVSMSDNAAGPCRPGHGPEIPEIL